MNIENSKQLRELYDFPRGRSKVKVFSELDVHAINFIAKSPFLVMSSVSEYGKLDASPRGGELGFVKVIDNTTLVIPDSKGNNRLDSIVNIVETKSIGLLFLIPGVDETLRVNGSANISTDNSYLSLFASEQNTPKCCVVIKVEEVFLHCAKALMRSKLWDKSTKINRDDFPSMGQMLKDQLNDGNPVESQEAMVKRYKKYL